MMCRIRAHKAVWYPGAQQVLEKLKNVYDMVVLSNCGASYRLANWQSFGMDRWFKEFYDCEAYGFAPKKDIIFDIMFIVIASEDSAVYERIYHYFLTAVRNERAFRCTYFEQAISL